MALKTVRSCEDHQLKWQRGEMSSLGVWKEDYLRQGRRCCSCTFQLWLWYFKDDVDKLERTEEKRVLRIVKWLEAHLPTGDWRRWFALSNKEEGDREIECSGGEKHQYSEKADFSPANKHAVKTRREILKLGELRLDVKHVFSSESN